MGTYSIGVDELIEDFENFLLDQEGEISALTIAECWNKLAKKYKWDDYLKTVNKFTKKEIKE